MTKDDIEIQEALDRIGQPTRGEILGARLPVPTPGDTLAVLGANPTEAVVALYRELLFAVGSDYAADELKLADELPSIVVRVFEKFSFRVDVMLRQTYNGRTTDMYQGLMDALADEGLADDPTLPTREEFNAVKARVDKLLDTPPENGALQ